MKTGKEIQEAFIKFWTEAPRNHKRVANVSLVPNNDPTLLFVNSGMFPLVPYLAGQPHPLGKRLCNFQRSIRTMWEDMEEIGDNRHTTCFNMMGNWSLGDYFKEEQLPWVMELYVERFGLDPQKIFVTVFKGNDDAPRDEDSIRIWKEVFKKYGIEAMESDNPQDVQMNYDKKGKLKAGPTYRIFTYDAKKNWWKRGEAPGELGGPTSEIFYDCGAEVSEEYKKDLHINDDSGKYIEVGNNVFMEFFYDKDMKWQKLPQKNVDFGGGFERVVFCSQGKASVFDTELYLPAIEVLEKMTGLKYHKIDEDVRKPFRVVVDHIRAATFIIGDGIVPSNKEQGYILRRFIRRAINFGNRLNLEKGFIADVADKFIDILSEFDDYEFLNGKRDLIKSELLKEEDKFQKTIDKGLKELNNLISKQGSISGKDAFYIFETFGFPIDLIIDELTLAKVKFDVEKLNAEFETEQKNHREQSRAGAEKKFKGGLADQSEETTRLHTTHHLLLAALQKVLGQHVHQKGSNITSERLRIDFSHDSKLTPEEVKQVEDIVNEIIDKDYRVVKKVLPRAEAERLGAEMEFGAKYGDLVNVYLVVNPDVEDNAWPITVDKIYSKEFCGGPHVSSTGEIGKSGRFKISKQENVAAGIKRIKAILEK